MGTQNSPAPDVSSCGLVNRHGTYGIRARTSSGGATDHRSAVGNSPRPKPVRLSASIPPFRTAIPFGDPLIRSACDVLTTHGVDASDPRCELRLRVLQELAKKTEPDALTVQFTRVHDLDDMSGPRPRRSERRASSSSASRRAASWGFGLMKPTAATKAIEEELPFKFTSGLFTKACKKLGVRPPVGDPPPPSGRTTSTGGGCAYGRGAQVGTEPTVPESAIRARRVAHCGPLWDTAEGLAFGGVAAGPGRLETVSSRSGHRGGWLRSGPAVQEAGGGAALPPGGYVTGSD